ncbi:hypothetical protein ON010_g14659 [Phytophthora cinnamomi]|nr:hypothetical protein ON010_g14659 [Phytophthora cinnamomi]
MLVRYTLLLLLLEAVGINLSPTCGNDCGSETMHVVIAASDMIYGEWHSADQPAHTAKRRCWRALQQQQEAVVAGEAMYLSQRGDTNASSKLALEGNHLKTSLFSQRQPRLNVPFRLDWASKSIGLVERQAWSVVQDAVPLTPPG